MSTKHRYEKLGGWLLALVVYYLLQVWGVVLQFGDGGLMDVLRGWSMYDGAQGLLLLANQVLSMLLVVIYVFTAIELIRCNPYFLRTRQLGLAASALDVLLRLVNGLGYGFTNYDLPMLILQTGLFLLSVVFVMLYYTRSVRVRTYMGTDEYLHLGFLTKKIKGPKPMVGDRAENGKTA